MHTPEGVVMVGDILREAIMFDCSMCDSRGYRPNGYVCDHVDHRPAYQRGMEMVAAALRASRKSSVRDTMRARRAAYGEWAAAESRRTEPSARPPQPVPCPDCGSEEPCEHDAQQVDQEPPDAR